MKYFFGFLATAAAIVVVILLVSGLFRTLDVNQNNQTPSQITYDLLDQSTVDGVIRITIDGPVVAEEQYRSLRITVSKNVRTIEVLKGYGRTVEKTQTFSNSPDSFKAFLGALKAADFAKRREGTISDPRATCVTGTKTFYELQIGSDKKVDTWSASCSVKQGSFTGNTDAVVKLFRNQIPSINDYIGVPQISAF